MANQQNYNHQLIEEFRANRYKAEDHPGFLERFQAWLTNQNAGTIFVSRVLSKNKTRTLETASVA